MSHSSQIEDEVDALYDLRPGEFVGARDALAKQVRNAGNREEAERIKALPRPSAAAWAVNQLARREPEWTQALVNAGQRMAEAHAALLEHGDRDGWRTASAEAREAIERLVRLAEGLLREERGSVSVQLREQVRETLQAATMDPEARELVAAGRLSKELRPPGGLPEMPTGRFSRTAPAASPTKRPRATARPRAGDRANAEREARAARQAAEREARAQLRRAERDRVSAATAAERAEQALLRAEKAREAAAEELATAERALADRQRERDAAQRAHEDAQAVLQAREDAIAEARAALDALGPASGHD